MKISVPRVRRSGVVTGGGSSLAATMQVAVPSVPLGSAEAAVVYVTDVLSAAGFESP